MTNEELVIKLEEILKESKFKIVFQIDNVQDEVEFQVKKISKIVSFASGNLFKHNILENIENALMTNNKKDIKTWWTPCGLWNADKRKKVYLKFQEIA